MKPALVCALTFALAHVAAAEVLLTDSFDYPNGSLTTVSSTWKTHSGTTGQTSVVSGRVTLNQSNSEDVNALLAGQPYAPDGATNVFYASFRMRCTTLPGAAGTYFAHFKDTGATGFRARIWALTSSAPPGKFRLGLSSVTGSAASATNAADLDLNTEHLVVVRLVNSNSATKLWINPSAESDTSIAANESDSAFSVAAFAFRQAAGEGVLSLDDLRVGTSFVEVVTNAIPMFPPSLVSAPRSQGVTAGTACTLSVKADGTQPLSFQWIFNGTNLPGATGSNLVFTNVTFSQSGFYAVAISNAIDSISSEPVALNIFSPSPPAFSLLSYNAHGNGVENWTTNSSHVRAIGRQVQFLDPDLITFQEIPVTNNGTAQMRNFVDAYRPGFYLATNSTDDGYIRSVILSRFPVRTSHSWLHAADLSPFGYTNSGFTRDLFEAEIAVPQFAQPLHLFTAHFKSGQDSDSAAKRAAEAGAISNFLVAGFLTTNALRPYILTGDLNEDILRPPFSDLQSVQRLLSPETGLQLATPFNPIEGGFLTYSIQSTGGLSRRYDYILPCTLLSTNVVASEVFRSDLLAPLPPNLFASDSRSASDHLPVLMSFGNPYDKPYRLIAASWSNDLVRLSWESVPGQSYSVESSSDLREWNPVQSNVTASEPTTLRTFGSPPEARFFRIRRLNN